MWRRLSWRNCLGQQRQPCCFAGCFPHRNFDLLYRALGVTRQKREFQRAWPMIPEGLCKKCDLGVFFMRLSSPSSVIQGDISSAQVRIRGDITMRLQLALNVRNMEEAVAYYSKLFGVQPHKERPGYANFAIDRPPLKLVLFENPQATERINHLGVEVFEPEEVEAAFQRLEPEGLVEAV